MGQVLMYLTRCETAGIYIGDGSAEGPKMAKLAALDDDEVMRRICLLLGCPLSRLEHFWDHHPDDFELLTTFWQLMRSRESLQPFMQSTMANVADMLVAGGVVPHYGKGCPKGMMRIVAFATFGHRYNVDSQVPLPRSRISMRVLSHCAFRPSLIGLHLSVSQIMRFMLLLIAYEWDKFLVETLLISERGGDPAAHYRTSQPGVAKVMDDFLVAAKRAQGAGRPVHAAFVRPFALRVFKAYMRKYPELRSFFDMKTGRLLGE